MVDCFLCSGWTGAEGCPCWYMVMGLNGWLFSLFWLNRRWKLPMLVHSYGTEWLTVFSVLVEQALKAAHAGTWLWDWMVDCFLCSGWTGAENCPCFVVGLNQGWLFSLFWLNRLWRLPMLVHGFGTKWLSVFSVLVEQALKTAHASA